MKPDWASKQWQNNQLTDDQLPWWMAVPGVLLLGVFLGTVVYLCLV